MLNSTFAPPILQAVADRGYVTASPIQEQTIPHTLAGRDVLGCAQTGTGKTAAFALPTLHRLHTRPADQGKRKPRCLVLAPTRELAGQIAESFQDYGQRINIAGVVIYGGVNQNPQVRKLQRGVEVIVATPGRLMDLMEQGFVDLSKIETFILDEADRMLDMGFIPDIRKINKLIPKDRQTLLFSATMPSAIEKLANDLLRDPVKINTAPQSTTAERVEQGLYFVDKAHKAQMLGHLLGKYSISRTIVFTRTKYGADNSSRSCAAWTSPPRRSTATRPKTPASGASTASSPGSATCWSPPTSRHAGSTWTTSRTFSITTCRTTPSPYVHRIGRTARAGASGMAITFCDKEERANLTAVQKIIQMKVPILTDFPEHIPEGAGAKLPDNTPAKKRTPRAPQKPQGKRRGASNGGGQPPKRRFPARGKPGQGAAGRNAGGRGRRPGGGSK